MDFSKEQLSTIKNNLKQKQPVQDTHFIYLHTKEGTVYTTKRINKTTTGTSFNFFDEELKQMVTLRWNFMSHISNTRKRE